jgi:hypothetical protein
MNEYSDKASFINQIGYTAACIHYDLFFHILRPIILIVVGID